MAMDYIRSFDIRLQRDVYYAGETLHGHVLLENTENIKIRGVRAVLRGKAHAEWKIMKSGERRTVKDDQYLLDDKEVIWGKDRHEEDGSIPILPRGLHQFPFEFNLPQSALPCSFESKAGTIRYYIKVVIDIPYASPPQGIKYFTIIGPHIDTMEEKYMSPMVGQDKKTVCCLCCQRGPIGLLVTLERTAYVCGENIRLHAQVENQSDQSACVKIRLVQYVEYFIDKGVLGVNKNCNYTVLEHKSPRVSSYSQGKYESTLETPIKLPVVPPTLIGVCRLIQIYYVLKVCLEQEKSGDYLQMDFPFTVATVPFRIPNSPSPPALEYDFCSSHVEGGMYISPEFQVGQVYDGTLTDDENVLLYRPVYVKVANVKLENTTGTPRKVSARIISGAHQRNRQDKPGFSPEKVSSEVGLSPEGRSCLSDKTESAMTARSSIESREALKNVAANLLSQGARDRIDSMDEAKIQEVVVDLHQIKISSTQNRDEKRNSEEEELLMSMTREILPSRMPGVHKGSNAVKELKGNAATVGGRVSTADLV